MSLLKVMASVHRVSEQVNDLVIQAILRSSGLQGPSPSLAGIGLLPHSSKPHEGNHDPLTGAFDGILWNTPKKRKSIARRLRSKFHGFEWGNQKILTPNRRLRIDHKTGKTFELGTVEPKAYKQAMEETGVIQERMREAFGVSPKDKEVVLVYEPKEGEEERAFGDPDRKIVEMKKERPAFFADNLMERSNRANLKKLDESRGTGTVRPSELG